MRGLYEEEAEKDFKEFTATHPKAKEQMSFVREIDQAALKAVKIAAESELSDLLMIQEKLKEKSDNLDQEFYHSRNTVTRPERRTESRPHRVRSVLGR